jgi:hypothetical protein
MPALLEAPPETDAASNPFSDLIPKDLIGGENGAPAYQTVGGRFGAVPKAEPTNLVENSSGLVGNPFADLVPKSPTSEREKALAETPGAAEIQQSIDQQAMERNASMLPLAKALDYVRNVGVEALSSISPEMSARIFGQTTESLRSGEIAAPLISPENANEIVGRLPAWAGGDTHLGRGLAEGMAGVLSSFSSPGQLAQLPAFAIPGFAETYVLDTLHGLPNQGRQLWAAIKEHGLNSREVGSLAAQYGITDLTAFLAAKGTTVERFRSTQSEINALPEVTAGELATHARNRIAELEVKPRNPMEQSELDHLQQNANNPGELGRTYGVTVAGDPRGVTAFEARDPEIAARLAIERATSPAGEPGAEPAATSGAVPERAQGVEPAQPVEAVRSDTAVMQPAEPAGNDWTKATEEPAPNQGGEPDAVPIRSAAEEIPRAAETGQNRPEDSQGVRPSEQGPETTGAPAPEEAQQVEAAGMKLRKRAGESGYTDLLPDVIDFGRRLAAKGMDYARWAKEMIRHLGEKIGEHLKNVWDSVKSQGDERGGIGGLAGKGFGLKISGKRNDLNALTGERSAKLQKSVADSDRAQKEINKVVPSKRRQAAISVNIEAGGDPALLAQWEGAAKGKAFKRAAADAQTLRPDEMAIRDKAKQAFDVLGVRGQNNGAIGAQLRDNYVTHVWDTGKRGTGIGSSKLQDKFKFAKARTFSTLFDGDQAGFTPKTMAIGDLLPAYMHELNKVIADRQVPGAALKGYGSDGRPLLIPSGSAKTVDATDFVIRDPNGNPLPRGTRAVYDTRAEAQAALQPGQVIEARPKEIALVNPHTRNAPKDAAGNPIDTSGYERTEHPALQNWRWVETDSKGNSTILKGDLLAHPELQKRLNAMMGQSEIRRWYSEPSQGAAMIPRAIVKGLDTAQSVMKREMFGLLAPFHQVQEGTHAIGHMINPFGGLEDMGRPTSAHVDAMEHGLMLQPEKTSSSSYLEGVGGKNSFASQAARKFGGPAGRMVANVIDGYQDYLFKQYIPALKFKTYEHIFERNKGRYSKELASGEVTLGDIKQLSAEQTNAAYGHLNYAMLDRNPTVQHFLQLGLLAPDFLEARGRFTAQALKGLASKGGHEQLRAIAVLAAVQAGAAFTLSKLLGDEWDPKHPFEVTHGGRTYTMRSVPEDLMRLLFSGSDVRREFMRARWSPGVSAVVQAGTGKNYRGEQTDMLHTVGELLANYIPITARQIPGLRQLTETGRNQNVSPLEQLAGSLGVKVSRYSPITKTYQLAADYKKAQGIAQDTGVYPVSKYSQLRYSLEDGDLDRARMEYQKLIDAGEKRTKIGEGFRESIFHPFTGSQTSDLKFKKSLQGDDRLMYDAAVKKRHEILKRYQAMRAGR